MTSWKTWLAVSQADLAARRLRRELRALTPRDGLRAELRGREVVIFSSNDYLGLSFHPEVRAAVADVAGRIGMGPRGASLVCGYTTYHEALEADLAALKGTETSLVFPTGYAANLAVMRSLASADTAIFSDELNHASIVDGCRAARESGATVHVYRHGDMAHLEELLRASDALLRLVVTDSVFSMDGDVAPLRELADLKRRYDTMLAVDEAHALLVLGETGGGAAEMLDVARDVDLHLGTLGKALGAHGGFVATSRALRDHILNRGRTFIYSTALPVPVVVGARAALGVYRADSSIRARLETYRRTAGEALGAVPPAAILNIVVGKEQAALRAAEDLLSDGFLVPAMRPPTVPKGTCRLRVTLSAGHTTEEVQTLLDALRDRGLV